MANNNPRRATLRDVRFSFVHVFEPRKDEETGKEKFSACIIIDKDNKRDLAAIKKCIDAAKKEGKSSKWNNKIPRTLKLPLRDGDEERDDDPAFENTMFLNANANVDYPPGVVDSRCKPIMEKSEFYSGVYGAVSLTFYPFDSNGNKGVGVSLDNCMKLKDGEPLAGVQHSAEDDFADFDFDEDDEDFDDIDDIDDIDDLD